MWDNNFPLPKVFSGQLAAGLSLLFAPAPHLLCPVTADATPGARAGDSQAEWVEQSWRAGDLCSCSAAACSSPAPAQLSWVSLIPMPCAASPTCPPGPGLAVQSCPLRVLAHSCHLRAAHTGSWLQCSDPSLLKVTLVDLLFQDWGGGSLGSALCCR